MNQAFEMNAEKLGFVKGELYELEKDNVGIDCQTKNSRS